MKKISKKISLKFFLLHRFFLHMFDIQFVQLQTLSDAHALNIRSHGHINKTILCVLNNFNFLWLI